MIQAWQALHSCFSAPYQTSTPLSPSPSSGALCIQGGLDPSVAGPTLLPPLPPPNPPLLPLLPLLHPIRCSVHSGRAGSKRGRPCADVCAGPHPLPEAGHQHGFAVRVQLQLGGTHCSGGCGARCGSGDWGFVRCGAGPHPLPETGYQHGFAVSVQLQPLERIAQLGVGHMAVGVKWGVLGRGRLGYGCRLLSAMHALIIHFIYPPTTVNPVSLDAPLREKIFYNTSRPLQNCL